MSGRAKGDAFEAKVFAALSKELQGDRLIVSPKTARIFRSKSYYSRDRQSDITTDVSIEAFLPGRDEPTFVWVFECKDYTGRVPVDDVEEFHAKLQQIGADNTKGTFVTSGALQEGALKYAESKKIGVVRLLPSDQIIVLMDMTRAAGPALDSAVGGAEFYGALSNPSHRSRRGFFASSDGHWFPSWRALLSHTIGDKE